MSTSQGVLPGFEDGRRTETVQYGLRRVRDGVLGRKGKISPRDSAESAAAVRSKPYCGWDGDEEIVTRTIVIYTTSWVVVPGYPGRLHLYHTADCGDDRFAEPVAVTDQCHPDCPVRRRAEREATS